MSEEFGKQVMKELSKELRKILGSGFSVSNLFNMRKLYITYPKFQTLSGKLSWSHYCELLSIEDDDYISLTDLARIKNSKEPKDVVKNWMRSRATLEYLGLWEKMNNSKFKGVDFDPLIIRNWEEFIYNVSYQMD